MDLAKYIKPMLEQNSEDVSNLGDSLIKIEQRIPFEFKDFLDKGLHLHNFKSMEVTNWPSERQQLMIDEFKNIDSSLQENPVMKVEHYYIDFTEVHW